MVDSASAREIQSLLNQLDSASYADVDSILKMQSVAFQKRQTVEFLNSLDKKHSPVLRAFWIDAFLKATETGRGLNRLPNIRQRYGELQKKIAIESWNKRRFNEAAQAFNNAAAAFKDLGLIAEWQKCLKNFATATSISGMASGSIGTLEEAVAAYKICLHSHKSVDHGLVEAEIYCDIGYALLGIGQINNNHAVLKSAVSNYESALSILGDDEGNALWGRAKNSLGAVTSKLGDLTSDPNLLRYSIALYKDAIKARSREDAPTAWLNTLTNIAHGEFLLSGLTGNIERLKEQTGFLAKTLAENSNVNFEETQVGHTCRQIASGYHRIGESRRSVADLNLAVSFYNQAFPIFSSNNNSYLSAQIKSHIATALFRIGLLENSTEKLQQALSIHTETERQFDRKENPFWWANWHRTAGDINSELYFKENHHNYLLLAINAYERAVQEYDKDVYPLQWANTMRRLCLRLSQKPAFLRDWNKIADLSSELIITIHALALTAITKLQQRALLSSLTGIGDLAAAVFCHLKEYDKAVQYLVLSRAVSSEISMRLNNAENDIIGETISKWQQHRADLDRRSMAAQGGTLSKDQIISSDELNILKDEHVQFVQEMSAEGLGELTYLDVSNLSHCLPVGGVFAAVFASECGGGVIFIGRGIDRIRDEDVLTIESLTTSKVHSLLRGPLLDGRVGWQQAYENYRKNSDAEIFITRERAVIEWNNYIEAFLPILWETLMGEISLWLEQSSNNQKPDLYIMVPGLLSILPLHAARENRDTGSYFIENWPVSYISSPRSFMTQRNKPFAPDNDSLLAVTDTVGDLGESINPAWSLFTEPLRRSINATATQFAEEFKVSQGWTYLCFFCHGVWNAVDPDQSHLIMADHSVLNSDKLRNMNLSNVRLVILGACESALIGTDRTPDEYVGLPTAFLQAGADCVAASQWLVDASSTYNIILKLMSEHTEGLSPVHALRAAQCAFISGEFDSIQSQGLLSKYRQSQLNLRTLAAYHDDENEPDTSSHAGASTLTPRSPYFWAAFSITGF